MLISCPECHFKRHVDEKQIPESATLATCPKCQNKFRFRDPETGAFLSDICLESEQGVNRTEAGNAQETLNAAPAGSPADNETQNPNQENMANEAEDVTAASGAAPAKPASSVTNGANGEDPVPLTEEDMPHKLKNSENPLQEPQFQAYEQAAKKRTQQYVMMTDDVPWEHPERYGILGALVQTVSRVMFRGREFFSTIHSRVSSLRPASFYALIGVFQALVAYFLSPNVLEIIKTADMDPQKQALMENLISGQSLPMLIISTPFIMILLLLVYTAFIYLAIRITNPEKADFPLTLRIIAYASAPMILSIVPYIGGVVGLVWFIYNIFIGVKYALRLTWQRTFLALAPIFILWLFIAFNQTLAIISAIQS